MAQITLSHIKSKRPLNVHSAYFSTYEGSSASYGATRLPDGAFMLFRFPYLGAPKLQLGRCPNEELAKRRLDWWVHHDMEVGDRVRWAMEVGQEIDIINLIMASAMQVT